MTKSFTSELSTSIINFKNSLNGTDRTLRSELQKLTDNLSKIPVVITFGGHFSSGKSTLLNGLLENELLPVDDLPETGAICYLSSGSSNSAIVVDKSSERIIDCTQDSLRKEIMLIDLAGKQNAAVLDVKEVRIQINSPNLPETTIWIDSPGINDSPEMMERAGEAADAADILVWVLNSRQPFSLAEQNFLANYIANHGDTGIVFVLNVFLSEISRSRWKHYIQNDFEVIKQKLVDRAGDMGLNSKSLPPIIAVCGKHFTDEYGSNELKQLLQNYGAIDAPSIQVPRLKRALDILDHQHSLLKIQYSKSEKTYQNKLVEHNTSTKLRQEFISNATSAVHNLFHDLEKRIISSGDSVANEVSRPLDRSNTYQNKLNSLIRDTVSRRLVGFIDDIQLQARQNNFATLSSSEIDEIKTMVTPSSVSVTVVNNSVDSDNTVGGALAGAAAGAAAGSFIPVIGTFFGALAGAAAGAAAGRNSDENASINADVSDTKQNIRSEAKKISKNIKHKEDAILEYVIQAVGADKELSLPSSGDHRRLRGYVESLDDLVRETKGYLVQLD